MSIQSFAHQQSAAQLGAALLDVTFGPPVSFQELTCPLQSVYKPACLIEVFLSAAAEPAIWHLDLFIFVIPSCHICSNEFCDCAYHAHIRSSALSCQACSRSTCDAMLRSLTAQTCWECCIQTSQPVPMVHQHVTDLQIWQMIDCNSHTNLFKNLYVLWSIFTMLTATHTQMLVLLLTSCVWFYSGTNNFAVALLRVE